MFQRKPIRRFKRHPNGRSHISRNNGNPQPRMGSSSFSNGQNRNKFRPALSAEKLFEKYSSLAKEALTSGDRSLSENYYQHADHFMRIIEDRNRNRNKIDPNIINKPVADSKDLAANSDSGQKQDNENKN